MVPCTHTVVVCVMKGWKGKPLINMGLLKLFSKSHLVVIVELTHTVVRYAHTVVVNVVKGSGGTPDKHRALKVVFQYFLRGLTHTVVPSNHTVTVCVVKGWRGKPLITIGLLKMFSSSFLRGIDPNSGSGGEPPD